MIDVITYINIPNNDELDYPPEECQDAAIHSGRWMCLSVYFALKSPASSGQVCQLVVGRRELSEVHRPHSKKKEKARRSELDVCTRQRPGGACYVEYTTLGREKQPFSTSPVSQSEKGTGQAIGSFAFLKGERPGVA